MAGVRDSSPEVRKEADPLSEEELKMLQQLAEDHWNHPTSIRERRIGEILYILTTSHDLAAYYNEYRTTLAGNLGNEGEGSEDMDLEMWEDLEAVDQAAIIASVRLALDVYMGGVTTAFALGIKNSGVKARYNVRV